MIASPDLQNSRSLYDSGKFDEALQMLRTHPSDDATYFYDLGTVFLRQGLAADALANLEKANRMAPHDPDIQHNLGLARKTLAKALGAESLDPASNWAETLSDRVPMDEVRGTLGLLAFILMVLWARQYWKSRKLKVTLLHPAGFFALLAFAITSGLYGAQRLSELHPPAVVLTQAGQRAVVRSGPGDQYLELLKIDAGVKIRLLGPTAPGPDGQIWHQIRFSPDRLGWLRSSNLLFL